MDRYCLHPSARARIFPRETNGNNRTPLEALLRGRHFRPWFPLSSSSDSFTSFCLRDRLPLTFQVQLDEMDGHQRITAVPDPVGKRIDARVGGFCGPDAVVRHRKRKVEHQTASSRGLEIFKQPERDGDFVDGLMTLGPTDTL